MTLHAMASGGDVNTSVLRVGGWAGILGGVFFLVGLLIFALASPIVFPPDFAQRLASFPENGTLIRVGISLMVVGLLLLLAFVAALYWSLREANRVFARIGLGSGILAAILLILTGEGELQSTALFSALYESSVASDRPAVVAAYAAVLSLTSVGLVTSLVFFGLAFVGFGLAMRSSPDYRAGFFWLTVVLGFLIVFFPLPILGFFSFLLLVVLAVVLGWKLYGMARTA